MAFATVQSWDETPASNTEIDGINIDEGCNPSGINNAIRETMSQIAEWTGSDTIASATTTDLSTVNGQFVTITGTTTITGLGTVKAGWVKFVQFSDALTLTHNATSLFLPGAANIVTASGDLAIFVSRGSGNWHCQNFMRRAALPMIGPSSSTDNAIARYDGTSATLQNSGLLLDDSGHVFRGVNNSNVVVSGGNSASNGANIELYGGTHATLANDAFIDADTITLRSQAGSTRVTLNSASLTSDLPVFVPDGTVSAPSIAPSSDTNTGIYALAADSLGFTMGGTHIGHLNSTGWTVSNTSGATTFGSVNAVKNLISGGGQIDVTNTTGGAAMRISRSGVGTAQSIHNGATSVGTIAVATGGASVDYNTTSNEDLKHFIGLFSPEEAIRIIKADPVRDWNWIEEYGGGYGVGWGAQTSYAISPLLATPGRGKPGDDDYQEWGVDMGKRTPYLWAAMTLLLDEREQMRNELTELRARLDAAGL